MKDLVRILKERNLTISSCESCTGGMFASMLTSIRGVSAVFKGAFVTYATEIKSEVVGVSPNTIMQYGVVSAQTAREMADQCREKMKSDLSVSFTGNAGPDVMENKPAGLIYCAISSKNETEVYEFHFHGERNEIREACVLEMEKKCIDFLGKRSFLTNNNCRR